MLELFTICFVLFFIFFMCKILNKIGYSEKLFIAMDTKLDQIIVSTDIIEETVEIHNDRIHDLSRNIYGWMEYERKMKANTHLRKLRRIEPKKEK